MKIINDIKNFTNQRVITSSILLVVILFVTYFGYDFMQNNYEAAVEDPLKTKSFTILTDFKRAGVDFTRIESVFERIFNYSIEINSNVIPSGYEGRYNPFSI